MKAQILIAKFHFNEKLLVSTSFQGLHVRSLARWDMRRSDPGNEVAFSSPHTFSYKPAYFKTTNSRIRSFVRAQYCSKWTHAGYHGA